MVWYRAYNVTNLNFPCSLTGNILSHSMKNLAFYSLFGWRMIILPIHTTSLTHFPFNRLGESISNTGRSANWIDLCVRPVNVEKGFREAGVDLYSTERSGRHKLWIRNRVSDAHVRKNPLAVSSPHGWHGNASPPESVHGSEVEWARESPRLLSSFLEMRPECQWKISSPMGQKKRSPENRVSVGNKWRAKAMLHRYSSENNAS